MKRLQPRPGRSAVATGVVNFLAPAYPVYFNADYWVFRLARGEPVPRKAMPVLTQFDRGETLAAPPPAG